LFQVDERHICIKASVPLVITASLRHLDITMITVAAATRHITNNNQPTVSKHWRRVVSHPDRPQSNQAHL